MREIKLPRQSFKKTRVPSANRRRVARFLLVGGAVASLVGGVAIFFVGKVGRVVCPSDYQAVCLSLQEGLLGERFFSLDLPAISERFQQLNPEVKIALEKRFPFQIRAVIEKRVGVAVIKKAGAFYLVDGDSFIFKQVASPPARLPVISLEDGGELFVGVPALSPLVSASVAIILAGEEQGAPMATVSSLEQSSLVAKTKEQLPVWFPLPDRLSGRTYRQLVRDLQRILAQAELEKRPLAKVDFRSLKTVVE